MTGTDEILILETQTGLCKADRLSALSGRGQNDPEASDRTQKEGIARRRQARVHDRSP